MPKDEKVWGCKIGGKLIDDLPAGSDAPMRKAVQNAFFEITGEDNDFCFSGWSSRLDKFERSVVSNPHGSLRQTNDFNTRERLYDLVDGMLAGLDEFTSIERAFLELLQELDGIKNV